MTDFQLLSSGFVIDIIVTKHAKLQIHSSNVTWIFIQLLLNAPAHKWRKKRRSSPKNCVSRLCNRRQMRHQSIISEPSHDHFAESLMVFLFSKSFPNRQVGNKACCTTTANDNIQWSSILCMHRHKHTLDLFLSLFGFFLFHLWCVHALYEHM